MESGQTTSTLKNIKELIAILEPYAPVWQEWKESGACILSKQEIALLQNYLATGSHLNSCLEFGISISNATDMLNRIKLMLCWDSLKLGSWLTERMLEKQGIITYESQQDKFLNSPLIFLHMPYDLKIRLRYLSEYTMGDILAKYTEIKLRAHWSLTDELVNELKELLKQNNCLSLLK